jgi:eukaryotic-like serine/threonine-protein kinase
MALLALARPREAAAAADAAAAVPTTGAARGWVARALAAGARALLATDDTQGALERSSRALALRDALGGVEEGEAEIFAAHAAVLRAAGRATDADEVRARGRERVRALAERIRDPVWRERFLGGSPAHAELAPGS